jgi:hypothetical protein
MDRPPAIFIILVITWTSLTNCVGPKGLNGQYGHNSWDGRHGHHERIKIQGNRFKRAQWSSNFFYPTKIELKGQLSVDKDSILFVPHRISFYRRSDASGKTELKKVKCHCDSNGLKNVDSDREWYIIASCRTANYFLKQDTLTEGRTRIEYLR